METEYIYKITFVLSSPFSPCPKRFDSKLWTMSSDTEDDDLFLVSFPKSGNTWVRFMLAGILYRMDMAVKSGRIVNDLVPDLDQYKVYTRYLNSMCFKSHKLPQKRFKRVIYVYRDGRDALCSYRNMRQKMDKPVNIDSLISEKDLIQGFTWKEHVNSWFNNPYDAEISYLKYEDLKANPVSELSRVLTEMNIDFDQHLLQSVVENCSIEEMKNSALKDHWNSNAVMKERGSFINKGESDTFRSKLTPSQLSSFNTRNEETLVKLGYTL